MYLAVELPWVVVLSWRVVGVVLEVLEGALGIWEGDFVLVLGFYDGCVGTGSGSGKGANG